MGFSATTLTANDVATQVKRAFGDEAGIQITDADIFRWINMAQREIISQNPIIQAVGTTDLITGQTDYNVSTLNIYRIQSVRINDSPIEFRSLEDIENYIMGDDPHTLTQGKPQVWTEWGGTLTVYPRPRITITGGIKILYLKNATPVALSTDYLSLPDEYFNRVVEFVMSQAYELDEDSQNSQFKISQMQQGLTVLAERENRPELKTYPTITFLPEDEDWYY